MSCEESRMLVHAVLCSVLSASPVAVALPLQGAEASLQPAADTPTALARLLGAYRFHAIAERVALVAKDASSEIASDVLLRVDAGNIAAERPARLRLDLGRLAIYAEGDRLIAVHTQNNEQYFEAKLDGGLSPESLAKVLPSLPLPQIGFALDRRATEELAIERSMMVVGAGETTWTGAWPLAGTAGETRVELVTTDISRLKSYTFTNGELTVRGTIDAIVTDDAKRPDLWGISTEKRTKVAKLTDLRALPSEVHVGDRMPVLGMHRHDLSGWSLVDALRSLQEQPPKANAMTAAAVICVIPSDNAPTQNILAAQKSLSWLSREFDNQRMAGITTCPRLITISVGVLELDQIMPAFVRQTREKLGTITDGATLFYWTSVGKAALNRIAPGTTGAVVLVIDSEQRLLGVIPLDNTLTDEETIAREVRAIVSERLVPGNQKELEGSGSSETNDSRSR